MLVREQQKNKKFFFISLLLHVTILLVMLVSFEFSSQMPVLENSDKRSEVINAMVMSAPPIPHKVAPQPLPPKPVLAKVEPKKIEPKPLPKKPEPAPVPVKKTAIAILDKKQKDIQKKMLEQQLLSDLKKQTQHEKKVKQKALENSFQQEMKELSAKSLQQQMLQEQKRIAGARTQAMRGVVDKYKALILQAISQNWLVPPTVNKKLTAELLIHLAPGGVVLDVQVMKSSGDESLDRSAQAAVFKASPLPVPHTSDEFEPFRQFVLKVKPENILGGDSWQG